MAGPGNKRKRPSEGDIQRPSPYRPQDFPEHHSSPSSYNNNQRGGRSNDGYRGQGRGGRGGRGRGGSHRGGPRNDHRSPTSPTFNHSPNSIPPGASRSRNASTSENQAKPAETSAPAEPKPAPIIEPPALKPNPKPYDYEILGEEFLRDWDFKLSTFGTQACQQPLLFATFTQELLRSSLDGRISPDKAGQAVEVLLRESHTVSEHNKNDDPASAQLSNGEIEQTSTEAPTFQKWSFDPQSLLLDSVAGLSETDFDAPALRAFLIASGISSDLMRQHLEVSMLEKLGLVRNTFQRMGIRKTTNLLYRQNNFNLLREETEGYSKLTTELFTASSSGRLSSELVEETVQRVLSLIGAFDLDVGRVLDVTLDVFAAVLVKQYRFFLKYLRASSWWPKGQSMEGLEVSYQGFSSLPTWALPGSPAGGLTEKDRLALTELKAARDTAFWARAREVGISAFFEIGGRQVKVAGQTSEDTTAAPQESDATRDWIKITGTLPPEGNRVAAQILGFKLRFYTSKIRSPEETLPENLIYLTALLIKTGFISLRDLYEHLYPSDEEMEAAKDEKLKEKAEKDRQKGPRGKTLNALALAGAIPDDSKPPPGTEFAPQFTKTAPKAVTAIEEKMPVADQKVSLLRSLLCIGAIPESTYILSRFTWLVDAYPDLIELIHRILHHSLDVMNSSLRPIDSTQNLNATKKMAEAGLLKGQIRQIDLEPRRTLRWAKMDKRDADAGTDYSFYWDSWADNVPVCRTYQDVLTLCNTFLKFSGVRIGSDSSLLIKLARIGRKHMAEDPSEEIRARWIDLSKRLLVPALSLSHKSPGIVNEVFEMIKDFSLSTRYSIYSEWYFGSASRIPDIKTAFDDTRWETKDVMKRISTTTVKPVARALAKATHTSPGIAFLTAFNQMETYDNLTETFIECARYFSDLAYDVLNWALMNALGGTGRSRVQADGMLTSKWLQVLSDFAGKLFKRYTNIDSIPVLLYVTNQVRQSNTVDLVVLSAIISSMSGITTEENLSEEQTLCLAGGAFLRKRAHDELLDKRYESRSGAKRLTKALLDSKIAGSLLVSIAQTRKTCIFNVSDGMHLKILANILDEITSILVKYLELLRSNISNNDFDKFVPDVANLIGDFGLEPRIAFLITRRSIAAAVAQSEKDMEPSGMADPAALLLGDSAGDSRIATPSAPTPRQTSPNPESSRTTNGDESQEQTQETSTKSEETLEAHQNIVVPSPEGEVAMVDVDQTKTPASASAAPTPGDQPSPAPLEDSMEIETIEQDSQPACNPVLNGIAEKIDATRTEKHRQYLSAQFYVTFWQSSLYDIWNPEKTYLSIITKVRTDWKHVDSDRSDTGPGSRERKDKKKRDLDQLSASLKVEQKEQKINFERSCSRMLREKSLWFTHPGIASSELNIALLEECFLPRLTMSPVDAVFCFKLIKFLHQRNTPNFRTIGLLDQMFSQPRLANFIFTCTSKEAENVGIFLKDVLEDLARLHGKKEIYQSEALGPNNSLLGFSKNSSMSVMVEYDEFRTLLFKWHNALLKSLEACLQGDEYMHRRNALFIMKAIHKHFPVVDFMGQKLLVCIEQIFEKDDREDLKLAARSLYSVLKPRAGKWMPHHQFRPSAFVNSKRSSSRQSRGSARATPDAQTQPEPSKSLNAKAEEFKPSNPSLLANSLQEQIGDAATSTPDKTVQPVGTETDGKPAESQAQSTAQRVSTPEVSASNIATSETEPSKPKKENIQAENAAQSGQTDQKASTKPQVTKANVLPGRPPISREVSAQSQAGRHSQYPQRHQDARNNDRAGLRNTPREYYHPEPAHSDRYPEVARDPPRERRGRSPPHYGPGERPPPRQWDREEPQWPGARLAHPPPRGSYEDMGPRNAPRADRAGPRGLSEWNERSSKDLLLDRNVPSNSRSATHTPGHPPRKQPTVPTRTSPEMSQMHPDRLAATFGVTQPDPPRSDRELRERGPQNSSQGRSDGHRQNGPPGQSSRSQYPGAERGSHPSDRQWQGRTRADAGPPPTEPRGDRPPRGPEASRELFAAPAQVQRPVDMEYGRLSREPRQSSRQQDPNYGRLNTHVDPPSTPAGNETRRGPPQGPSSRGGDGSAPRSNRRDGHPSNPSSVPSTPVGEMSPNDIPLGSNERGGHRTRNSHANNNRSLQIDTNGAPRSGPLPSPSMNNAPSGPRGGNGNWNVPSSPHQRRQSNTANAPAEHGREANRQMQGIQNLLQQQSSEPDRQDRPGNSRTHSSRPNGFNQQASSTPPQPSGSGSVKNNSGGEAPQTVYDGQQGGRGPRDAGRYQPQREERREENGRDGEQQRRSTRRRSRSASPGSGSRTMGRRDEQRGRKPASTAGGRDERNAAGTTNNGGTNNPSTAPHPLSSRRGGGGSGGSFREDGREPRRDLRDRMESREDFGGRGPADLKRRVSEDVTLGGGASRDEGSSRGYRRDDRDGRKRGRQAGEEQTMNGERTSGDAKRSRR